MAGFFFGFMNLVAERRALRASSSHGTAEPKADS
jgi:hypothetical protein